MRQFSTKEWVGRLEALKIGCGPINRLSEVFADPHVLARGMVVEMAHPQGEGGVVKVVANPVKLSATPPAYRLSPPALGQHTEAVLGGLLGMEAAEIAALREKGVV
jgi:crotonobetainyl-CoA:carnitine CoA-transferase CaiB-like acyl-CoA transferase